ncbi:hypothetical protein MNBD_ALPHA12-2221, partial [hydrothermal vent metagenome]
MKLSNNPAHRSGNKPVGGIFRAAKAMIIAGTLAVSLVSGAAFAGQDGRTNLRV